jgi:hypothetical protein
MIAEDGADVNGVIGEKRPPAASRPLPNSAGESLPV